jgi:hypothetical protein
LCAALLGTAIARPIYDTPFGRQPRANLFGSARLRAAVIAAALALLAFTRTETREPCAKTDPLRQPYFGDTHVHTAFSFDAWGQGTLARPGDAYRFARGEAIGIQPFGPDGQPHAHLQLRRPLDFAVVTDHSDLLGETEICQKPELPGYDSLVCRVMRRFPKLGYALINGFVYSSEHPTRLFVLRPRAARAAATPVAARGARSRRPPRRTTTAAPRAGSPRSSATNGPACPRATTCTAT